MAGPSVDDLQFDPGADTTPKIGKFETSIPRSGNSEMKSLCKKLNVKTSGEDYDITKETFLIYVPEGYKPAKPMGLVVLMN